MEIPELTERLIRVGRLHIEACHPQYAAAFRKELGPTNDVERARTAAEGLSTERFNAFARLLTSVHDLELLGVRVKTTLRLLQLQVAENVLADLAINQGTWVDNTFNSWLIWMYGYLERARTLFTRLERSLVKMAPTSAALPGDYLASVDSLLETLNTWRNETAHGGGPVENIAKMGWLTETTLLEIWVPITAETLKPYAERQDAWHTRARAFTERAMATVLTTAQVIVAAVDWPTLEGIAGAGGLRLAVTERTRRSRVD